MKYQSFAYPFARDYILSRLFTVTKAGVCIRLPFSRTLHCFWF